MAVVQKEPADSVWCGKRDCAIGVETGEGEHHLVNFAIAVTAHADKLFFALIQKLGGAFGVPAFGKRVPRTVVEIVAKHDDCVTFFFKGSKGRFEAFCASVDVG